MLGFCATSRRGSWLAAILIGFAACGTSPSSRPPLLTTGGEGPSLCEPGISCPTPGEFCPASGDAGCRFLVCTNLIWACAPDGGLVLDGGIASEASQSADAGDEADAGASSDAPSVRDAVEGAAE